MICLLIAVKPLYWLPFKKESLNSVTLNILGDSRNYKSPMLVPSSAKRIATEILLIAKLSDRKYFILRVVICDIIRPSKEIPVRS